MSNMIKIPTIDNIQNARRRIAPFIHRTPIFTSTTLNAISSKTLYFKCENLQKTGSFKARGATNALLSLCEQDPPNAVATHSSGNHAAALSWAAGINGIKALIVMPENAPEAKVNAVRHYGGDITFCRPTLKARETTLTRVLEKTSARFIHPYDHQNIICGQGTAAIELLQSQSLDAVIAPVGGGGLLSGSSLAVRALSPKTKIYGAEPAKADDAYRSFQKGHLCKITNPNTVADGLRTNLSELTFAIIKQYVDNIFLADEAQIIKATRLMWERMKIIVEPSAAVPLAALWQNLDSIPEKKIGIIVSGGNMDLKSFRLFNPERQEN